LGESKGVALAIDTTWLNFPYLFFVPIWDLGTYFSIVSDVIFDTSG
jgi:hypothetical protein